MLKYLVGKIDHIQEQIKFIAERKKLVFKSWVYASKKKEPSKMKISFTELIRRPDTTEK